MNDIAKSLGGGGHAFAAGALVSGSLDDVKKIIELSKKPQPIVPEEDFPRFQKIVKAAFSQRRKMLKNTLNSFDFSIEIQEKIDFTRRPETLTIKEFSELAKD